MSSPSLIGASIAVFIVAALLYFQSMEGFTSTVPADLNTASISRPSVLLPTMQGPKPPGIPGPTTTPKEAIATKNELAELDSKLTTWLSAANQRELENPASLSPFQRQQRIGYQSRISTIRQQLGTGLIVDKSKDVSAEILKLRNENAGWQVYPMFTDSSEFAPNMSPTAFLSSEQYKEFRGRMLAGLKGLQNYPQAEPLILVRQKQLEEIDSELRPVDAQGRLPPIRIRAARDFLVAMMQPTQPLPSLISIDGIYEPNLVANPLDVIRQVQTISNPPQYLVALANYLSTGNATSSEVMHARSMVAEHEYSGCGPKHNQGSPWLPPENMVSRANTLCKQIHEAFPFDAESLGCPKTMPVNEPAAETLIYTVCQRIRETVPNVTPEQFYCPRIPSEYFPRN
jgi:hypothetical protein